MKLLLVLDLFRLVPLRPSRTGPSTITGYIKYTLRTTCDPNSLLAVAVSSTLLEEVKVFPVCVRILGH